VSLWSCFTEVLRLTFWHSLNYIRSVYYNWQSFTLLDLRFSMNSIRSIFRDMTQCCLTEVHRRFRGAYYFHLQGWRINQATDQMQAAESNRLLICLVVYCSTLKMKRVHFSETSLNSYRITWRYMSEDNNIHGHHCETLKSNNRHR
jgi:hypothetical protein